MSISVFSIYPIIIVLKFIFFPGIVRRVYVDEVDFALVGEGEGGEGGEVVALDEEVVGAMAGGGFCPFFGGFWRLGAVFGGFFLGEEASLRAGLGHLAGGLGRRLSFLRGQLVAQDAALGYFLKYGQLAAELFFYVFGLVFPDEAVLFAAVDQADEVGAFVGGEAIEGFELVEEVLLLHGVVAAMLAPVLGFRCRRCVILAMIRKKTRIPPPISLGLAFFSL